MKAGTTNFEGESPELSLVPQAKLFVGAERAIAKADMIIIAPGNFYCSIMPALIVDGMKEAINSSKAEVLFISNLVNRDGQTGGFAVADYLKETRRLTDIEIDAVLYNTASIAPDCLREGEEQVSTANISDEYEAIGQELADDSPVPNNGADKIAAIRSLVRHDQRKLAEAVREIAGGL